MGPGALLAAMGESGGPRRAWRRADDRVLSAAVQEGAGHGPAAPALPGLFGHSWVLCRGECGIKRGWGHHSAAGAAELDTRVLGCYLHRPELPSAQLQD